MATLAEINKTLLEQNKSLQSTSEGVKTLSRSLVPFVKGQKGSMLDDLEERREKKSGVSFLSAAGGAIRTTGQRAGKAIGDFKLPELPPLSTLLNPIALGALATTFLSKFLKKLTKGGLLAFFAEEIAEFVVGDFASDALKKQLTQGLTFAGAGLLFGPRVALLSFLVGFFLKDPGQVFDKLKEITSSQSFENIRTYIQDVIVSGLEGLLLLMQPGGIFKVFEEGLVKETLVALGLLATAVATIFPVGGMFKIAGLALWFGGKIKDALVGLGKLALAINASGATGFGSGVMDNVARSTLRTDSRGRQYVETIQPDGKKTTSYSRRDIQRAQNMRGGALGRMLRFGARGAVFLGPGLVTLLATAGFAAAGAGVLFAGGQLAKLVSDSIQNSAFAQFLKGPVDPLDQAKADRDQLIQKASRQLLPLGLNKEGDVTKLSTIEQMEMDKILEKIKRNETLTSDEQGFLNMRNLMKSNVLSAPRMVTLAEAMSLREEGAFRSNPGLERAMMGNMSIDQSVNNLSNQQVNMLNTLISTDNMGVATNG